MDERTYEKSTAFDAVAGRLTEVLRSVVKGLGAG
jgi:hypothetical protein